MAYLAAILSLVYLKEECYGFPKKMKVNYRKQNLKCVLFFLNAKRQAIYTSFFFTLSSDSCLLCRRRFSYLLNRIKFNKSTQASREQQSFRASCSSLTSNIPRRTFSQKQKYSAKAIL